jgi:hypothetical protein
MNLLRHRRERLALRMENRVRLDEVLRLRMDVLRLRAERDRLRAERDQAEAELRALRGEVA